MKIIILGAGKVGGTLAENLANERFDITVVDKDPARLRELRDRLDIQTVEGLGSLPHILEQAGAEDADMLIAVTNSDEVNMIACQICYSLFRTPTKIARVRAAGYMANPELFSKENLPVDVLISPEQVVTDHVRRLIEHPGALQVLDFADGRVELVAVRALRGGPLVDRELRLLKQHMPAVNTRVAAIFRKNRAITPTESTVIEEGDEVFFIAAREDINSVMSELRRVEKHYRRIVIAGGGHIGERLALAIEKDYSVKIIEPNLLRCQELSERLSSTVVLQGDATDQSLLIDENIEEADMFCALTNDDEANIMSAMLAKRLGARKVMSLIGKVAYVDLLQGGEIDVAISPQQATTSMLLTHVRRGDVARVHSLRRGAAEAIEAIVHGDARSSKVVGRKVSEVPLPPGTTIGAIVRGEEVLIGDDSVVLQADDHIILFLVDKKHLADVERLFQVGVLF